MSVNLKKVNDTETEHGSPRTWKLSGAHQRIVALTAHAMKGDEERCLAPGMDGYLTKPIRPEELDGLLERCMGSASTTSDVSASVDTK